MAYQFQPGEPFKRGVRRIARQRLAKAREAVAAAMPEHDAGPTPALHGAVHRARKRLKEFRSLLRLVRPGLPAYAQENVDARDAARLLAPLRDAQTLVEAFDAALAHAGDAAESDRFAALRTGLAERRAERVHDVRATLEAFVERMDAAGERTRSWAFDGSAREAMIAGIERTHARCRREMERAREAGTAEAFHEWRKRVKTNRHHLRLLGPAWPAALSPLHDKAKRLGDLLGRANDQALLAETLSEAIDQGRADRLGGQAIATEFIGLATAHRAGLQARALELGARLYAPEPKAIARHARVLLEAWPR